MKSLTEREIMNGTLGGLAKLPSKMTKLELVRAINNLTEEERYRFEERLGMLCGNAAPTTAQLDIAWGDVIRFNWDQQPKERR